MFLNCVYKPVKIIQLPDEGHIPCPAVSYEASFIFFFYPCHGATTNIKSEICHVLEGAHLFFRDARSLSKPLFCGHGRLCFGTAAAWNTLIPGQHNYNHKRDVLSTGGSLLSCKKGNAVHWMPLHDSCKIVKGTHNNAIYVVQSTSGFQEPFFRSMLSDGSF